jgi:hypothetical protein
MSPGNQDKGKNLKQKITIGIVVVVLGFVAWQAIGMFGGGGSSPAPAPTNVPNKSMSANPQQPANNGSPAPVQQAAQGAPAAAPTSGDNTPKQAPVLANAELLQLQQETQAKYIAALNELEMLKVQKSIAETKQAITTSTLATATAEKNITDLLTTQVSQMPSNNSLSNQYSPFASSGGAGDSGASPSPSANGAPAAPVPIKIIQPETQYFLQSVAYKSEKWSAVLMNGKNVFIVEVGDTLPPDGSIVTGIDKNAVTLSKDKVSRHIQMSPVSD